MAGRPKDPALDAAIRRAARALVHDVGHGGFSVEEVARRAGIPKSTVYARWRSRVALLDAVLADAFVAVPDVPAGGLQALVSADRDLASSNEGRAIAHLLLGAQDPGGTPATAVLAALDHRRAQYADAVRSHRRISDKGPGGSRSHDGEAADLLLDAVWGCAITGRTDVSLDHLIDGVLGAPRS